MVQNNSEFPILAISHLFQSFPTKSGINSYRTSNLGCSGPFPIFPKLFGMLNFGHLTLFPIFSHQSGPKLFGMLNFTQSTLFPIFSYQSGPKLDDTISFIVIAIVSHAPRDKRSLVEPLYISTCISRLKRLLYIQHTTKYYNKYVLNDHTELSYLSGSISSKNLNPSLPSICNNRERFNGAVTRNGNRLQATQQEDHYF